MRRHDARGHHASYTFTNYRAVLQKITYKDKSFYDFMPPCNVMCSLRDITGWRSVIGCLKLQVIFRKRATNYRALLQE